MLVDPIVADQPDELSGVYQYVFFLPVFLPVFFYQDVTFLFKEMNTIVIGF